MTDSKTPVTEEELAARATAPRVTTQGVEQVISAEHYFTAYEGVLGERFNHQKGELADPSGTIPKSLGLLTFCVLTLRNGYTVVGKSASASFENFNEEIGRRIARSDAINSIWPLLGYQLRDRLHTLSEFSQQDQALDEALTHLLAAQLGNTEVLKPHHIEVVLSHFTTAHPNSTTIQS
jgi:hypothetical protein